MSTHQYPHYPGTGDWREAGAGAGAGLHGQHAAVGRAWGTQDSARLLAESRHPGGGALQA